MNTIKSGLILASQLKDGDNFELPKLSKMYSILYVFIIPDRIDIPLMYRSKIFVYTTQCETLILHPNRLVILVDLPF
jgi:hypothetical protein